MKTGIKTLRENWGSNLGFIMAATPCSLSFGSLSSHKLIGDRNIFDSADFLVSNIMLPLGGVFLCVLTGWIRILSLKKNETQVDDKNNKNS